MPSSPVATRASRLPATGAFVVSSRLHACTSVYPGRPYRLSAHRRRSPLHRVIAYYTLTVSRHTSTVAGRSDTPYSGNAYPASRYALCPLALEEQDRRRDGS